MVHGVSRFFGNSIAPCVQRCQAGLGRAPASNPDPSVCDYGKRISRASKLISQEQRTLAALHVAPPVDTSPTILCLFSSQAVEQLTLPFTDREVVEDDQPQLTFALVGADAL